MAVRFFQLLSGHAMTAPFLRDRWGQVDLDRCWWCDKGRQSREHLFKECTAWSREIKKLLREVGKASGARMATDAPFKSRKGLAS